MSLADKIMRRLKRAQLSLVRWWWLARHKKLRNPIALFIVGAQRSGTTMLVECLENSPECEVYGETSEAFERSTLKSLETARNLIERSSRPFVAFKPLTDSHRVQDLLAICPGGKAIWMYRRPQDRANSAVARFGDTNLQFLRELVEKGRTDRWEARGITDETLDLVSRFDLSSMSPESAAGVFWYIRNQLFFDQKLEENPNVLLLKYELLVSHPEEVMRQVCGFVGSTYSRRMTAHIHARSVGRAESRLSPDVEQLCGNMLTKLNELMATQWRSLAPKVLARRERG